MTTYVAAGSRAGIKSPVVTNTGTGNTYMVSGLGAQTDASATVTGVASSTGIGGLVVQAPPTYMISSSRAGLQSVVVADYTSNNTYMVSNVGAEEPPVIQAVSPTLTLTGVASSSAVGTPSVTLSQNITLTGVAATSATGDPSIEIDDAALIGQVATTAIGTVAIEIDAAPEIDGVDATSAAGDPTTDIIFMVIITGVVATPLVGLLLGTAVPIVGVEADIAIGSLSVDVIDGAILDGVSSTVTLGTLALQEDNNPSIVGVQTTFGTNLLPSTVEPVVDGVEVTGDVGEPIPTNMQLPGTAILVQLGMIGVSADNAVLVGLQSLAQVGVPLAISTGNHSSVAVTGVAATPSIGTLISQDGIAISGVEADSAISDVAVATSVSSALVMTDIQIEAILELRDDFSVTLRWSDTDGYSWSDSAIRSIGQTGNYLCNPQWRRLGMSRRGRVYELSWSCPQATALQGATVMYQDAST